MRSDDRGAIMVVALFLAVFGIAILFTAVGVAETVFFRERVQDGADAAALSSAVTHARAMNLLVLINIVMAALLAVLVTLKLVETLAIAGIVLASALAFPTYGASLAAVPPLKAVQAKTAAAYKKLKNPIHEALEVLKKTSDAVVAVTPGAVRSLAISEGHFFKPQVGSVHVDAAPALPVEDDDFATLCGKAGELPFELAKGVMGVGPMAVVWNAMGSVVGTLTEQFSQWFCGDGTSSPPSSSVWEEGYLPELQEFKDCQREKLEDKVDLTQVVTDDMVSDVCLESERVEARAQPHETTGECQRSCQLNGPYDRRVIAARAECGPEATGIVKLSFDYWERRGTVEYEYTRAGWVRKEPSYERSTIFQKQLRFPCAREDYNPVVRDSDNDDVNDVQPACTDEKEPVFAPHEQPHVGFTKTVHFTEVVHILGCNVRKQVPVEIEGAETAEGGDDKAPKRIEEGVGLGGEEFQIRSVVSGDVEARETKRVVRLALWQNADPSHPLALLSKADGLAVAQAEYFYDAADGRDAWMWNMKWRGRMKRFRLPDDENRARLSSLAIGCAGQGARAATGCFTTLGVAASGGGTLAH